MIQENNNQQVIENTKEKHIESLSIKVETQETTQPECKGSCCDNKPDCGEEKVELNIIRNFSIP